MRYTCALAWALVPFVSAAILPAASHHPAPTISSDASPQPSTTSSLSVPTKGLDRISKQSLEAYITLPCQGCKTDGGDAFLPFNFSAVPTRYNECRDVPFILNGQRYSVKENGRDKNRKVTIGTSVDGHEVQLTAELFCFLPGDETLLPANVKRHYVPHVQVTLDKVNGKTLYEPSLFSVVAKQYPSFLLESLTVLQSAREEKLISYSTLDSKNHHFSQQNATWLLSTAASRRASLREQVAANPQRWALSDWEREQDVALSAENVQSDTSSTLGGRIRDAWDDLLDNLESRVGSDKVHELQSNLDVVMTSFRCHVLANQNECTSITAEKAAEKAAEATSTTPSPKSQSTLVRALEILAAAIGLGALLKLIQQRFCSLRRRVERLADREERQTARAYRRAARREAVRKRWQDLRSMFRRPQREQMDEEKLALLLEAGKSGTHHEEKLIDVDACEDELVGLRYAHEMVTAMVHATEQGPARPITLAKARHDARSRTDSLPSYSSEILPGYASQTGSEQGVVDGFRPRSVASSRGSTAVTPDSSIPDLSRRCSSDTLRSSSANDD